MSEYQWYEFVALDRPLTAREMAELRAISTRATITPTRFWNEYQWGDLKADPARLLAQYFDAHLYFANWGTRRLMLRVPAASVDVRALRQYFPSAGPATVTVTERGATGHVILDFTSESDGDDDADPYEDSYTPQSLGALTPLRAGLVDGDLSVGYVAWLLAVQVGSVSDDATEPPVPAGLATMSAALAALAEFVRIDGDLLAVAREAAREAQASPAALRRWVTALPSDEKDRWLLRAMERPGHPVREELLAAYQQQQSGETPARRTVTVLRAQAETVRESRRAVVTKRKNRERTAARAARRRHLTQLAAEGAAAWERLDRLVGESQYEEAVRLTVDLRDVAMKAGALDAFELRYQMLRKRHPKRRGYLNDSKRALSNAPSGGAS